MYKGVLAPYEMIAGKCNIFSHVSVRLFSHFINRSLAVRSLLVWRNPLVYCCFAVCAFVIPKKDCHKSQL